MHNLKAFAEHPRIAKPIKRVDLSIVNKELDEKVLLCVEFKYQFTNDSKRFEDYGKVIKSDFHDRNTDLFILIVCDFDKQAKSEWDKEWGISNDLSQYIAKNDEWKARLDKLFVTTDDAERVNPIEVVVDSPFGKQSSYYFYMLSKK